MCLNLSKTCGILYRIRYNLTTEALRTLNYSLCYPYLIYCVSIWGCIWTTVVKEVFVAQRRILRTYKDKYESTDLLFNDLRLLRFDLLLKYFMMLSIYRNTNDNDPNAIFNMFHHRQGIGGNHLNLICPQAGTTLYKCSIHCVGLKVWNTLPHHMNSCTYFNTFKSRVKK